MLYGSTGMRCKWNHRKEKYDASADDGRNLNELINKFYEKKFEKTKKALDNGLAMGIAFHGIGEDNFDEMYVLASSILNS